MYVSTYYPETAVYKLQDLFNQKYPVNLFNPDVSYYVSHASKLFLAAW